MKLKYHRLKPAVSRRRLGHSRSYEVPPAKAGGVHETTQSLCSCEVEDHRLKPVVSKQNWLIGANPLAARVQHNRLHSGVVFDNDSRGVILATDG
jgi:hypothetical protein